MIFSKQKRILSAFLSLAMIGTMVASVPFTASAATTKVGTSYSIFEKGWSTAKNGAAVGKANKGLCVEALKASASGATLNYAIYENKGWKSAKNGAAAGKANKKLYAEALKVSVSNSDYSVSYSIFEHGKWLSATNGKPVGTANKGFKIEALKISVTKKSVAPTTPTVASVSAVPDATVAVGTDAATAIKSLPATVDVTLSDGTTKSGVAVTWAAPTTYDAKTAGTYAFTGTLASITGVENTDNVTATANVVVGDSKVASVVPTSDNIPVGGTTTFAFKNAAGDTLATPTGTTYVLEDSTNGSIDTAGKLTVAKSGAIKVDVTAGSDKYVATVNVYGAAAGVKLSAKSTTVLANGSQTAITATVVDANGIAVPTFSGLVNVAITSNGAVKLVGSATSMYANGVSSLTGISIAKGVGTFNVISNTTAGLTDTISLNNLTATNATAPLTSGITYGTLAITTAAATAAGLKVNTSLPSISVNSATASNVFAVNAQVADSTGTGIPSAQTIVLTITGPGSFSASDATQKTLTVYSNASNGSTANVNVYGTQGVAGSIVITATSGSLTTGTATVPAYVTTGPSTIKITSATGTASNGAAYTTYTAQVVDTNGNLITSGTGSSDAVSITDNTSATGGTLTYFSVDSNGAPIANSAKPLAFANGVVKFAVENTAPSATAPTITVKDTTLGLTQTTTYSTVVGSVAKVGFTTSNPQNVQAGTTLSYSVQLQDVNGNAVKSAGVNVVFTISNNLPANAALTNGLSSYVVATDANGIATVSVSAGSSTSGSFTVNAQLINSTSTAATSPLNTVVTPLNYAAFIGYTGTATAAPVTPASTAAASTLISSGTGSFVAGTAISGLTATLYNPLRTAPATGTTDQVTVTTSNPAVVGLTGGYDVNSSTTKTILSTVAGVATLPTLNAGLAGSSTITIADKNNAAVAPVSITIIVTGAAVPNNTAVIWYNNAPISPSNGVTVGANAPVQLTVFNTDAGGNQIPVTAAQTGGLAGVTYTLSDSNPSVGHFRLSANGDNVSTVTIPVGQSYANVWYVNATANTYTGGLTAGLNITTPGVVGTPVLTAGTDAVVATVKAGVYTLTFAGPWANGDSVTVDGTKYTLAASTTANAAATEVAGDITADATLGLKYTVDNTVPGVVKLTQKAGKESPTAPIVSKLVGSSETLVSATITDGVTAGTTPATADTTVLTVTGAVNEGYITVTVANGATTTAYRVHVTAGEAAATIATDIGTTIGTTIGTGATAYTVAPSTNTVVFTASTVGVHAHIGITVA